MALLFPLLCYFIVKGVTEKNITMPPHFLPDSVITEVVDGKKVSKTIYHQLNDFTLTNQNGEQVSLNQLKGKIIVANFFFTHCPTICPRLTTNMHWLETSITNAQRVGDKTPDFIHYLSFSIDPERDSVHQLKKWADRFQVNPELWWLLTGDKKTIYDMAVKEMKVPAEDGGLVDSNFIHTDRFILIDGNRQVRGYYNGLDTIELKRLSKDAIMLSLEKQPGRKSFLAGKIPVIAVAFGIVIAAVGLLVYNLRKRRKNVKAGNY